MTRFEKRLLVACIVLGVIWLASVAYLYLALSPWLYVWPK